MASVLQFGSFAEALDGLASLIGVADQTIKADDLVQIAKLSYRRCQVGRYCRLFSQSCRQIDTAQDEYLPRVYRDKQLAGGDTIIQLCTRLRAEGAASSTATIHACR
jgi:hypothetical protein